MCLSKKLICLNRLVSFSEDATFCCEGKRGFLQVEEKAREKPSRELRLGGVEAIANIRRGGKERGRETHIHIDKKGNLQFVYVHIMRVCAPVDVPQMGEVCVGFSGNRIMWAHN